MNGAKSFCIAKRDVWEAYRQVKANRGTAGVDGQSLEDFDGNLSKNLYRIWNRMCSGSYFPLPVRRVDIPKGDSGGTRPLGIPTVSDRIAQMVVKRYLEPILESVFHRDSYGYRPGKSAHDALVVARRRCWDHNWVLDLDIKSFFDEIDWSLLMLTVCRHTDCKWVLLYLKRWLEAPVSMPDGTLVTRDRGTPQGAVVSPVLANLFLHYAFDCWMQRDIRTSRSRDTPMMRSVIAKARLRRLSYVRRWKRGLRNASYNCTRRRPRLFTARTPIGRGNIPSDRSTFLGTHFVQERLSIARANASSHSFQRSARRPPRKCGAVCGAGDCIVVTIWNWKKSPAGFARSLQAGCATMAGFTPRSFRRSCAR